MNSSQVPDQPLFLRSRRVRIVWIAVIVGLALALLILALVVRANPESEVDVRLLDEIGDWGADQLGGWYELMSDYSGQWPAVLTMFFAVFVTMLVGRPNNAVALALTLALVGTGDLLLGFGLGEFVAVDRPHGGERSFPSGHVAYITSASIMLFYVAFLKRSPAFVLIGLVPIFGFLMFSSGVSRVYLEDHWPSDILGGYILGVLAPLVLIPVYHRLEKVRWITPPRVGIEVPAPSSDDAIIAGSYGSAVVIEPEKGTATKYFDPPVALRVLYWLSFQKPFPYVDNEDAIEAAVLRRQIAGQLTRYRFGKDLVAQVTRVDWNDGKAALVTEYIQGEEPGENVAAWDFLGSVEVLFEEAGLPGWQLNPHNPHAHTNLVRTDDGSYHIIDMESGFVTPFPTRSNARSSMKHGTLPVFDDIDFERLNTFTADREADLRRTLGDEGYEALLADAKLCEAAYARWYGDEPRIWGRAVRWLYRALNIQADFAVARRSLAGARHRAVSFLEEGLTRWEAESRISADQAATLRARLNDPGMAVALEHLGAHLMLSVVLRFPIGSITRVLWVLVFMIRASVATVRRRPNRYGGLDVHNPLVLLWAGLPGVGAIAYVFSRPLLRPVFVRLLMDQVLYRMPLGLHRKLAAGRWLAPRPKHQPVA